MDVKRRGFVGGMIAGMVAVLVGGWTALRSRVFPGRVRRLEHTSWKEQGKWLG